MTVLTAVVVRLDGTVAGLVPQHNRRANRMHVLEDRQ